MTLTQLAVSLVEHVAGPQHGEDAHARDKRAAKIAQVEKWLRKHSHLPIGDLIECAEAWDCVASETDRLRVRLAKLEAEHTANTHDCGLIIKHQRIDLDHAERQLALALHWGAELAQHVEIEALCADKAIAALGDAERHAYAIGRRDGLGVGAHSALVADERVRRFLNAYHAWVAQPGDSRVLDDERWAAWEALDWRPGLGDGR